ncbi:hypothetical protein EWM64_g304 [Hericium alpestre]|uniref:Methyltransferase domain-containing protein n=1 Tax=Hericium alpestre TaxID=135208 RepID=A0A4Z0ABI5_9AGAM|nr:hypothetical protein EWM64_g304 [Hericium alpestre]
MPADDDEVKRFELFHRMIKFVLGNQNYVGPVKELLSSERARTLGKDKLRVLDLGTGGGLWAIDMADEFPHVEVTGVDLAPLQPRLVPPNCTFELCDLDTYCLPYPSNSYDVIHARNMHTGVGLRFPIPYKLTEEYQRCLTMNGIDVTVPPRMGDLLYETGWYKHVLQQHADIPIGFWPKDPTLLTVGQLAWQNHDLLLHAVRPMLLSSGLPEPQVKTLVAEAQRDLYYPLVHIASRLHVVHAIKSM